VPELVSQRRRWLNGAFFAAVYAQTHFTQIWQTDHSFRRKVALHVEFFYQFINLVFSFFSLVCSFLYVTNLLGQFLSYVLLCLLIARGSPSRSIWRGLGWAHLYIFEIPVRFVDYFTVHFIHGEPASRVSQLNVFGLNR
jgi:cellulose synthase/poly-beta-1,6-N-acetylglucosamine synthase-like glycosyltransferase